MSRGHCCQPIKFFN